MGRHVCRIVVFSVLSIIFLTACPHSEGKAHGTSPSPRKRLIPSSEIKSPSALLAQQGMEEQRSAEQEEKVRSQLKRASAQVNLWTCFVITIFLLIAVIRLEKIYRNHICRFVFYSMSAWLLGWVIWTFLWGVVSVYGFQQGGKLSILVSLLSDLNTIFFILAYIGLTRGREFTPTQYLLFGFLLVFSVACIDIGLLMFPEGEVGSNAGPILQERWSLALSMLSPVLLGWAFRLRYATSWVLIVGISYAFLQPPAYQALFSKSFMPDVGAAILSILAMLKVVYAFSVLSFLAKTPSSAENLIQSPIKPLEERVLDPLWRLLPFLLLIVGCTAAIVIVKFRDLQVAWSVFVSIGVYLLTMAGLLKAVEFIGKQFRVRVQTDDKARPPSGGEEDA